MSQSLRAIKRFRIRELVVASPKARTPSAATTSAPNQPQRPPAAVVMAAASPTGSSSLRSSGGGGIPTALSAAAVILNNPFVPHKNPKSGRWAPPKYSHRRQADLIKHGRKTGTLHLLPPGPKMSEVLLQQHLSATAVPSTLSVGAAAEEQKELAELTGDRGEELVASGLVSVRRGKEPEQGTQGEDGRGRGRGRGLGQDSKDDVVAASVVDHAWTRSVEWVGTVRERSIAGAEIGNRLYAGKKRMFKGHKWERTRERRVARTKMLLRDMDKRVQRFRGYRAKGKPLPLARRSDVLKKTQKLPF